MPASLRSAGISRKQRRSAASSLDHFDVGLGIALILNQRDEIIALRTNIRKAAEAKVSNGTLAVTDLLREINSENKARQVKALHEVQLLMNIYQLKYTTNN